MFVYYILASMYCITTFPFTLHSSTVSHRTPDVRYAKQPNQLSDVPYNGLTHIPDDCTHKFRIMDKMFGTLIKNYEFY